MKGLISKVKKNSAAAEAGIQNGEYLCAVNGTELLPGEIFSLNDTLGPRTAANGYVDGYVINKGRLVKEAGGGSVSQAASMVASLTFCTWPTS